MSAASRAAAAAAAARGSWLNAIVAVPGALPDSASSAAGGLADMLVAVKDNFCVQVRRLLQRLSGQQGGEKGTLEMLQAWVLSIAA